VTQNPNPYPHKFNVSIGIPAFIEKYTPIITEKGQRLDNETVSTRKATRARNSKELELTTFSPSFPRRRVVSRCRSPSPEGSRLSETPERASSFMISTRRERRSVSCASTAHVLTGRASSKLIPSPLSVMSLSSKSSPRFSEHLFLPSSVPQLCSDTASRCL
jgi:hypothetical protein